MRTMHSRNRVNAEYVSCVGVVSKRAELSVTNSLSHSPTHSHKDIELYILVQTIESRRFIGIDRPPTHVVGNSVDGFIVDGNALKRATL